MDTKPTWKNTLNTSLKWHGHLSIALEIALKAGYPFMTWNGRVYKVTKAVTDGENTVPADAEETELLVADLN